jgi:hypothetical protein
LACSSWSVASAGAAARKASAPVFFIEEIRVETERLSPEIVLSESLLHEGREYDERQLREAVHRINRLPFVLLAEFSLEKGSERGRYRLVITVYETRRWFFQVQLLQPLKDEVRRLDPRFDGNFDARLGETIDLNSALVGRRFAAGRRGLLFASFGTEDGAFALGYQRFNLWNRNILFSLTLGTEQQFGDLLIADSSFSARAQLGIPIRGNHALRLLVGRSELETDFLIGTQFESSETMAEAAWVFNSLDDPVLAREGSLLEVGLTWSDLDDSRVLFDLEGRLVVQGFSATRTGLILAADRHWPLAAQQSLSAGVRGFASDSSEVGSEWEAEGSLGHQVFLVRQLELDKWRELRLETEISVLRQDFSSSSWAPGLLQSIDSWRMSTGLVYRNGWGLFRFSLDYLDRELR